MRRFRLQGDGVKNELLILDTKCSVKNANLLQGICYGNFKHTYMPEFLKTGLAKIRTHSTTWQLKTIRFVQRPIKKPISDAGQ